MKNVIDLENHKSRLLEDPGKGTVYVDLFTYGKTVEFNAFYLEPGEGLKIDRLNGRLYSKATHTEPDETQKFKSFEEGVEYFNQFVVGIEKGEKDNANKQATPEKQEEIPFDQVEVTNEGVTSIVNHDGEKTTGSPRKPGYLQRDLEEIKSNISKLNDTNAHKAELIQQLDNTSESLNPLQVTALLWTSEQKTTSYDLLKTVIDPSLEYHQMWEITKLAADIKDKPVSRLKEVVVNTDAGAPYEVQRTFERNQAKRNIADLDEDPVFKRSLIDLLDEIQDVMTNEQIHMLYTLSARNDITFKAMEAAVNIRMKPSQMKMAAELAISNKEMSFDDIESIVFQQQLESEQSQMNLQENNTMNSPKTTGKTAHQLQREQINNNIEKTKMNISTLDGKAKIDQTKKALLLSRIDNISGRLSVEQSQKLFQLSARKDISVRALEAAADTHLSPAQMEAAAYVATNVRGIIPETIQEKVLNIKQQSALKYLSFDQEHIENISITEKGSVQKEPIEQVVDMCMAAEKKAIETEKRSQANLKEDDTMNYSGVTQKTPVQMLKSQFDDNIDQAKANIAKLNGDESRKKALLARIDSIRDGMSEEQSYELYNLSTRENITVEALDTATDIRLNAVQMNAAAYMAMNNEGISPDAIRDTILTTKHQSAIDFLASRQEFTGNLDTIEKAGASKESIEQAAEMYTTAERDAMKAEANLYKMSVEEALAQGKIKVVNKDDVKEKSAKSSDMECFKNVNATITSYFRGMRDTAVDFMKKVADIPRQAAKELKDKTVNAVDHFQDNVQNTYETKFLDYTKKKEIEAKTLANDIKEQMQQLEEKHKSRLNAMYHIDGLKRFITGKPEISKEEFAKTDSVENNRQMKKLRQRYGDAMSDVTRYSSQRKELEKSIEAYREKWEKHKFGSDLNEKVDQAAKAVEIANEQVIDTPVIDQKESDVR